MGAVFRRRPIRRLSSSRDILWTDTTFADFNAGTTEQHLRQRDAERRGDPGSDAGSGVHGDDVPVEWSSTAVADGRHRDGRPRRRHPGRRAGRPAMPRVRPDGGVRSDVQRPGESERRLRRGLQCPPLGGLRDDHGRGALRALVGVDDQSGGHAPPGELAGLAHLYRIDWGTTTVTFWIDGVQVAQHIRRITSNMRPLASDRTPGAATWSSTG